MTSNKPKGKMREGEEEGGSEERCVREGREGGLNCFVVRVCKYMY